MVFIHDTKRSLDAAVDLVNTSRGISRDGADSLSDIAGLERFLRDHPSARINICSPELYILVRHHAGHVWTTLKGLDVTEYFSRRPAYRKGLADCLSLEDQAFYRVLGAVRGDVPLNAPASRERAGWAAG